MRGCNQARGVPVHRREVILAGFSLPLLSFGGALETFAAPRALAAAAEGAFDDDTVARLAQALAARPYRQPDNALPPALSGLGYDEYRDFRYRAARALWRDEGLPFHAQFFHRGFLFGARVDVYEVSQGRARPVRYSPSQFEIGRAHV